MATSTDLPTTAPITRLLTAADLAIFPTDLPSGQVNYELINGRLMMMFPPGDDHCSIQA